MEENESDVASLHSLTSSEREANRTTAKEVFPFPNPPAVERYFPDRVSSYSLKKTPSSQSSIMLLAPLGSTVSSISSGSVVECATNSASVPQLHEDVHEIQSQSIECTESPEDFKLQASKSFHDPQIKPLSSIPSRISEDGDFDSGLFSTAELEQVIDFIKSCVDENANKEVSLPELEAAVRKHKQAICSEEEEKHARGLMESLEFLLKENQFTPMTWFKYADVRGGVSGDGKLTYPELFDGINGLCDSIQVPRWSHTNIFALLRYMDPNGDGDLSAAEVKLAFRKLTMPPAALDILNRAGPLMDRMEKFMRRHQIRVHDLFRQIDTDCSGAISIVELKRAFTRMFGKHRDIALIPKAVEVISVTSNSSGWAKYNGISIKNKPALPPHILHGKPRFQDPYYQQEEHQHTSHPSNAAVSSSSSTASSSTTTISLATKKRLKSKKAHKLLPVDDHSYQLQSIDADDNSSIDSLQSGMSKYSQISQSSKDRKGKLKPMKLSSKSLKTIKNILKATPLPPPPEESMNSFSAFHSMPSFVMGDSLNSSSSSSSSLHSRRRQGKNLRAPVLLSPIVESNTRSLSFFNSGNDPNNPSPLKGSGINITSPYFQKKVYSGAIGYEGMIHRYSQAVNTGKFRLASI